MGIRLLRGPRLHGARRRAGARRSIVINETMAAKYWPGEDPIGKRVNVSYNNTRPREIVGIVGDVKQGDLTDAPPPQMYTPFVQTPWPFLAAVVRTTAAPEAPAGVAARRRWRGSTREQAAGEIRTLDRICRAVDRDAALHGAARRQLRGARAAAGRLRPLRRDGVFGGAAAPRDRHPHGARRAGGAMSARWSSAQALRIGAAGLAIGLAGALLVTRVLDSLLFGVTPSDPLTFAARLGGARRRPPPRGVSARRGARRASTRWWPSEPSNHADFAPERRKVLSPRRRPHLRAAPRERRHQRGRVRLDHGAVRRRQVDAAAHPRHARQRVVRRVLLHGSAGSSSQSQTAFGTAQEAHRLRVSELPPARQPDGLREPGDSALLSQRQPQGSPEHGRPTSSTVSRSSARRISIRTSCRAGSSSWSAWRAR